MTGRAFSRLVKIADNSFVIDSLDPSLLGPVLHGKEWFFSAYGRTRYISEVEKYLVQLGVTSFCCLSFNVFAAALSGELGAERKMFDAWDNFLKFPEHRGSQDKLRAAYERYSHDSDFWTTNSQSNKLFYESSFGVEGCRVIGNGVDVEEFSKEYAVPDDLRYVERPVIGVGAKVTHLLDYELINHIVEKNRDLSFVLIGQILDRSIFRKIKKKPNFYYLGDKPYSVYPAYVRAFDVCLIPYVAGKREHGGDSIKFYEYLAAGKPIVTAMIEGVSDEYANVFVADGYEDFSQKIRMALDAPSSASSVPDRFTWRSRTHQLLRPILRSNIDGRH